ncbi:MAG: sensor histidine kinase [Eubacteriales bacterium]
MEKMPLLILILYSIPESLILISLSSSLYGYDVKANLKRILLLSISLAVTTELVRALPIQYGENILIQIPIFVLMTAYFLKVSLKRSFIMILTGFVILNLAESSFLPIAVSITGRDLGVLLGTIWSRLIVSWCMLLALLIPTVIIIKKRFSLTSAIQFFKTTSLNTKITLIVFVVLIQALLAGILQLTTIHGESSTWPVVFKGVILQRVIGFALITIPIVSIFLLKRLFALSQQEAIIATQETFLDNINNLFVTVRGQRHDFINHVQVIYSLLKSNQTDDAVKYMDNLLDEIQEVNDMIKTKNPALSALLNTKQAMAERHNISFDTTIETSIQDINIKSLDLVKILGNLLDNAIEAVMNQPPEFRIVKLSVKKLSNMIVFEVFNPRPVILPEQFDKIFTGGFSTKKDTGHSGIGLAIVKEIAEKYNGHIGIKSSEKEGTTFTVVIPR